jgi:hypothetical protein
MQVSCGYRRVSHQYHLIVVKISIEKCLLEYKIANIHQHTETAIY